MMAWSLGLTLLATRLLTFTRVIPVIFDVGGVLELDIILVLDVVESMLFVASDSFVPFGNAIVVLGER